MSGAQSPTHATPLELDTLSADAATTEDFHTLVLGIGNLLWADEAFGIRCVDALYREWQMPRGVRVMDGGTQGLYLVHYVERAKRMVVFDAVDWGDDPGTLRLERDDAVPRFMGCRKMSLHQTGFQEVLSAASLLGGGPEHMTLVGVQAEMLEDWCGPLRDSVRAKIDAAVQAAIDELAGWGIVATRRKTPLPEKDGLMVRGLGMDAFENGPHRDTPPTSCAAE